MSTTDIELRAPALLPPTQNPVGLHAIALEFAALKRYDVGANRGYASSRITLNVPRVLLERLDAELARPYAADPQPVAWLWRDGYHVEHVWRTPPPKHISAEAVYAAPVDERRRALEECLALCDAVLNAVDRAERWSQPAVDIRDDIAALLARTP
ncbi:hypothetical protein [Paraburkholderia sp. MM6662-R1]|uniref:hypothetical protein n=1 Tax=Paraburkholderia sp. MM6662-R1 TaxID=2991066 RepID=UPI003D20937C